ncbi:MAG: hypothetical protein KDI33_00165 [Halioglobus sp.]|nr:hypothetical protein [Halioglobus sp.]
MISHHQAIIGSIQKEEERGSVESPQAQPGRTPGIAEEISEDAYKQNYVYKSCTVIPQKENRVAPLNSRFLRKPEKSHLSEGKAPF